MRKQMWFGTKGFETWVNVPAIDPDYSGSGFSRSAEHVNGGITLQKSVASHKRYEIRWNKAKRSDIETIQAFSQGIWGDDLIYFVEPMAMDRNVANQMWGTPSVAGFDGVPIFQDQDPTLIENSVDPYSRYPRYSALYRNTGVSEKLYVPIPPGFCAWVGVHGSSTGGAGIQATPLIGLTEQTVVELDWLPMSGTTLVNTPFDSASYTGLELSAIETGLLRNLATNPGFEVNTAGAAWNITGGGGATLARVAGGHSGSFAARLTYTANATSVAGGIRTDTPVEEGKTYSFGVYYRASKITRVQPILQWLDANGVSVGSVVSGTQAVTTAAPSWASAPRATALNVTAPAGAAYARLQVRTVAGTSYAVWVNGDWLEIDDVQVNEGNAIQPYTDGDTAGWEWAGVIGSSISLQTPDTMIFGATVIQILPSGMTPKEGPFIPPRGHGGCRFDSEPTLTPHSARLDLEELSAVLVETGPWE